MKTINVAATAWVNANSYPKNKDAFRRILHRTYKRGVEFAQRWISVENELPEERVQILMKRGERGSSLPTAGFYFDGNFRKNGHDEEGDVFMGVTYWRLVEHKIEYP